MKPITGALIAALLSGAAVPALAQPANLTPEKIAPAQVAKLKAIQASKKYKVATAKLEADWDRIVADLITLTEIEAPPFKEDARGRAYMEMLKAHGLTDVQMDKVGNVYGTRKGTGGGPLLVVTGHMDTVFPAGTNVKVRREGDRLSAPGIADDTSSLPMILAFIRAMDEGKITTKSDIIFMGNVGEEGQGDLRGMRYLFGESPLANQIKYFISFEPGTDRVTNGGVGSKRYRATFKGPGGHSLGAFGIVNPSYALGNFLTEFGKTEVPKTARTVFNVGVIEGGTSVNSIPFSMTADIDMRSEGKAELKAVEDRLLAILPQAVAKENADRSTKSGPITLENKLIGDRPVGVTDPNSSIVQIAAASMLAGGVTPKFTAGSTDSNIPMSLGREAITLGSGFSGGRAHSLEEYLTVNPQETLKYMKINLATVLALAGAEVR
jgi:acetylornithine deacetylase/succinyl-diaminopimelate desuccinylase-like protein